MKYIPRGVCSREINYDIIDGCVRNVTFLGGCNGNLKAIGKLIEGKKVEDIIGILKGNTCGMRNTSCADQLAKALEEAIK